MDWVLEHLQVLFLIAVAVVAILQKLKTAGSTGAGRTPSGMDPEQAERTRRIQEEIRRRIMERRGATPVPPAEAGPADQPPPFPEAPPVIEAVRPVVVPPPPEDATELPGEAPAFEPLPAAGLQEQMMRQLQELEAARAARRESVPTATAKAPAAAAGSAGTINLRQAAGLRRAMVWREILGPPVGLR